MIFLLLFPFLYNFFVPCKIFFCFLHLYNIHLYTRYDDQQTGKYESLVYIKKWGWPRGNQFQLNADHSNFTQFKKKKGHCYISDLFKSKQQ